MTEVVCRWWMVPADSGRLTTVLERVFAIGTAARVAIREPEVWGPAERWPVSEYHDGRLLTPDEAVSLVGVMLAGAEFWCRLVTDHVEVYVTEDAVYLGSYGSLDDLGLVDAEPVGSSPYAIDRAGFPYYPPADDEFWAGLHRHLAAGAGELLVLQQWAAGFGGERWYLVASAADLEAVRQDVLPRAVFAVFRRPRLVRRAPGSRQSAEAVLGDEMLLGGVRIFHRSSASVLLTAARVADDDELRRAWELLGERDALFSWDDDADPVYAARPDPDGQVRVAGAFQ
ncbi:hypothetical protein [Dactylosporangium sp. NPDC000521]|uniref:hypothetical protein n=1 Tax=Dactylosporangium sp. NPDC000521 TaxID=3363975 RepID=UPI003673D526